MRKQIAIIGSFVVMAGSAFAGEQATDSSFKQMDA
jgi:hypothetical protein